MKSLFILSKYLKRPLKDYLWLTVVLWVMSSVPMWYWILTHNYYAAIDVCLGSLFVSYLLCLLFGCFQRPWGLALRFLLFACGLVNVVVDCTVYHICKAPFNLAIVGLLRGTTLSESMEFIQSFFSLRLILPVLAVIIIAGVLTLYRHYISGSCIAKVLVSILVIISMPAHILITTLAPLNVFAPWKSLFLFKTYYFYKYDKPVNLSQYRIRTQIELSQEDPVPTVLVILGESVSRSHCSLYGYEIETFPSISLLSSRDSVVIFSNVNSASYTTCSSMKMTLSTCESEDDREYYKRTNIFDLVASNGYFTSWISNQSAVGLYDNLVTTYAELADTMLFVGANVRKSEFDGVLLEPVKKILNTCNGRHMCFVHTMGCHEGFISRYPESWALFSEKDYRSYPLNQRRRLSEYDNALRYDDYVVSELFSFVSSKDAIALFVPDHGLDLFVTASDYYGHAREGDAASIVEGKRIPFLIYCPLLFRTNHPELYEYLRSIKDESFDTKYLIDLLANICGIKSFDR